MAGVWAWHETTLQSLPVATIITLVDSWVAMDDCKKLALLFSKMNEYDTVTSLRQVYPYLQDVVDNKVLY